MGTPLRGKDKGGGGGGGQIGRGLGKTGKRKEDKRLFMHQSKLIRASPNSPFFLLKANLLQCFFA